MDIEKTPKLLAPLTLAFVGDGVYELMVRKTVVSLGDRPAGKLNEMKVNLVRAGAQALVYDAVLPLLSEEESDILKRGRNANTASVPKHAQAAHYRKATGVEALFGYLYLSGETTRLEELFATAMNVLQAREGE